MLSLRVDPEKKFAFKGNSYWEMSWVGINCWIIYITHLLHSKCGEVAIRFQSCNVINFTWRRTISFISLMKTRNENGPRWLSYPASNALHWRIAIFNWTQRLEELSSILVYRIPTRFLLAGGSSSHMQETNSNCIQTRLIEIQSATRSSSKGRNACFYLRTLLEVVWKIR